MFWRVSSHHRQTACDECLVLHRIETGVDTQHVGELLCTPTHGVDEVATGILDVFAFVVAHQGNDLVALAPDAEQLSILIVAAAERDADTTDIAKIMSGNDAQSIKKKLGGVIKDKVLLKKMMSVGKKIAAVMSVTTAMPRKYTKSAVDAWVRNYEKAIGIHL